MRHFPSPAVSLVLAGFLTAGLVSCSVPAETDASSATAPAEATAEASDGGAAEAAAPIPPEFTAPVGDDFTLGERVDDASGLDDVATRTYRPIRVAPDSPLLDYEITEDYALQDPDWIGMMEFPDDVSDAAMATASRFVVETWMDSRSTGRPIRSGTSPGSSRTSTSSAKVSTRRLSMTSPAPGTGSGQSARSTPIRTEAASRAQPGRNRPTTSLRRAGPTSTSLRRWRSAPGAVGARSPRSMPT